MSIEIKLTSDFRELSSFVERLDKEQLKRTAEIAPSIHRIAKIRGRIPEGRDVPDIYFDLVHFEGKHMPPEDFKERLKFLIALESSYYPVASNLAVGSARGMGLYERTPDFIDQAKSLVAKIVWVGWKPELGEKFLDLHKRIMGTLNRFLVLAWRRTNFSIPFGYIETSELDTTVPYHELEAASPRIRPIFRLRNATGHLSLPSIISAISPEGHLGKIATLAVMGYYPDGHGLGAVAKELGVKRERLTACLDEVLEKLAETPETGSIPDKSIKDFVKELQNKGVLKYKSGKNVEITNPRLRLLGREVAANGSDKRERAIISLARKIKNDTFVYDIKDIAERTGSSRQVVRGVINRVAVSS